MKTQKNIGKTSDSWGIGWLSWLLLCGAGCSGCYQPTVVPPTASISPPKQPSLSIPQSTEPVTEPLSPPSNYPIDPIKSTNPWKPEAELRKWDYIVLHHTASNAGSAESIHLEHLNRKDKNGNAWLGIGYHFVIGNGNGMEDGEIESTFRWKQQLQGAHAGVANYNQHGIGIVLIGNFEQSPPTDAQTASAKKLVSLLKREYGIASNNVIGHGDVKATECPGKHFPMDEIRDGIAWRDDHAELKFACNVSKTDRNWRFHDTTETEKLALSNQRSNLNNQAAVVDVAWTHLPGDSRK